MRLNEILNNMDKRTRTAVLTIFLLILSLVSLTAAYFVLNISGNPTADTISVVAADLRLKFTDTNVVSVDGVLPGYETTKTFTVKNEGNVVLTYIPYFDRVANTYVDQTDLVYIIECTSDDVDGTCYNNIVETQLPNTRTEITRGVTILPQETHTYTMTLIFKDTNDAQDDNQNRSFKARVMIKEDELPILTNYSVAGGANSILVTTPNIASDFSPIETYYYKYEPVAQNMKNTFDSSTPVNLNNELLPSNVAAGEYVPSSNPSYTFEGLTPGDYIITSYVEDDRGRTSNEISKTVKVRSVLQSPVDKYSALFINAPVIFTTSSYATFEEYGQNIESISFATTNVVPNGTLGSWDVSESQDGSIMAWYTDTDTDSLYEIVIGQVGGVYAGPDCSFLFANMRNVSLIDLTNFHTDNAKDINNMFLFLGYNVSSFHLDVSNFNTNNIVTLYEGFVKTGYSATDFSIIGLDQWDVSNVESLDELFGYTGYSASTFEIDLTNWDISKVQSLFGAFGYCGYNATTWSIGNLSNWDTSNVTLMDVAFAFVGKSDTTWSIGDLSNWDTSKVTSMRGIFGGSGFSSTTWSVGDLSNWDTSNVTNLALAFTQTAYNASSLDLSFLNNWDVSSNTTLEGTFANTGYNTANFYLDLSNWDTSNVTTMLQTFYNTGYRSSTINIVGLDKWNTENVTSMDRTFYNTGALASSWNIGNIGVWDTHNVRYMNTMFANAAYYASTFSLDLSSWDTSNVENMINMFNHTGYKATSFSLTGLDDWDVRKVENMLQMFTYVGGSATSWTFSDLSNWDTAHLTTMNKMFYCAGYASPIIDLDLSNFNVSGVTDMSDVFSYMGYRSSSFNLSGLENWDVSNVVTMVNTFASTGSLATSWSIGDISGWDVSSVENMSGMFTLIARNVPSLTIDLRDWDTSSVTNMNQIFKAVGYAEANTTNIVLRLYLNNWDTSHVTNMNEAFAYAGTYSRNFGIYLDNWTIDSATTMTNTFKYTGYYGSSGTSTLNISHMLLPGSLTSENYTGIFASVTTRAILSVPSITVRDWILSLSTTDRPSAWTTSSFIVSPS